MNLPITNIPPTLIKALVIFVDIRGFTRWSSDPDVHDHVVEFIDSFDNILSSYFPEYFQKLLGDGAMLILEMDYDTDSTMVLNETLEKIKEIQKEFKAECEKFYNFHGAKTKLHLGWGITRGDVWQNKNNKRTDYLGKNINVAARMCSSARPFGIIIDADDFRKIPDGHSGEFSKHPITLDGFDRSINAWVTNEIAENLMPRETTWKNPSVFVSGVCLRWELEELEILVMQRSSSREFHPGLYEVTIGGHLSKDETFYHCVSRLFEDVLEINVEVVRNNFLLYKFGNRTNEIIPGIRCLCWYKSGIPKLKDYDSYHWMKVDKFSNIPESAILPDTKDDVLSIITNLEEQPKSDRSK